MRKTKTQEAILKTNWDGVELNLISRIEIVKRYKAIFPESITFKQKATIFHLKPSKGNKGKGECIVRYNSSDKLLDIFKLSWRIP